MDTQGSLRDRCRCLLPLIAEELVIGVSTLAQLTHFQNALGTDGLNRMTCRPVKTRSSEEREAFYSAVLEDVNGLTLGLQRGSGAFDETTPILGKISVFDFNPRNRSAEIGYVLLPEYRGRGHMKSALWNVCAMLLRDVGLNKLYAQTGVFNEASVGLLRSLGFCLDAVLRQHHELDGALYDDLVFSLLTGEAGFE